MGDVGTHAHNLVRFITGLEVVEVCAEGGAIVPGRKVDDYAGALLRLENGARGSFWGTQAAAGVENLSTEHIACPMNGFPTSAHQRK